MSDPRDYKLDLASVSPGANVPAPKGVPRPFLMVHFKCCGVYQRIYRNNDGSQYSGHCPKCARVVRFKVQPGGTDARSFEVE